MQTAQKIERKAIQKMAQIPARRERLRRVSDREALQDIRAALQSTTASGFLFQYNDQNEVKQ
jgi:hypothetical protein